MEENDAPSTEALTRKLHEILTDSENDVGQCCFKEETIENLMQELYKEIIISSPPKPPSPTPTPTPTPLSSLPSSSNGSLVVPQNDSVELRVGEEKEDEEDFDDEWLARVLSWTQGQVLDISD